MKCNYCGAIISNDSAKFCSKCGNKVNMQNASQQSSLAAPKNTTSNNAATGSQINNTASPTYTAPSFVPTPAPTAAPPKTPKKKRKLLIILASILAVVILLGSAIYALPKLLNDANGASASKGENSSESGSQSSPERKEIAAILEEAEKLSAQGNYEAAWEKINAGLVSYPESAALLQKSQEYSDAINAQAKAATLKQAEQLAAAGDYLGAMQVISHAQEKAPDDEDYSNTYDQYNRAHVAQIKQEAINMKFCDQCGNALKDSAKFCPSCGATVESDNQVAQRTCSKCGEPMDDSAIFCEACGARYNSAAPQANTLLNPITQSNSHFMKSSSYGYILEYLNKAASLEKSLYTQDTTIEELEAHIDSLGHPEYYQVPQSPNRENIDADDFKGAAGLAALGAMGCFFIGIFAGWTWTHVKTVALVLFVGGLLLAGIVKACDNKRNNKQYESEMAHYSYLVAEDKKRVNAEKEEANALSNILRQMQDKRDETDSVRKRFYAEDVIFPKYRNLITVCTFYEYFLSQRCFQLTGPGGAYNTYENEMRLDMICTKLDDVIEKLEQIKANQSFLYDAIQEGNQISQKLLAESIHQSKLLNQAVENTALTAHYSEIDAKNSEACALIGVANYLSIEDGKRH